MRFLMQPSNTIKKATAVCLMLLALTLGMVSTSQSQSSGTGAISGTVRDPKGLVVPGASVVVRNMDTGVERTLTINEAGLYSAPYLQSGLYEVRIKKGASPK